MNDSLLICFVYIYIYIYSLFIMNDQSPLFCENRGQKPCSVLEPSTQICKYDWLNEFVVVFSFNEKS
jgi:hypothetical protein